MKVNWNWSIGFSVVGIVLAIVNICIGSNWGYVLLGFNLVTLLITLGFVYADRKK